MSGLSRKIIIVGGDLSGGGAERQLEQLARALTVLGHSITVATLAGKVEGLPFDQQVLWDGRRRFRAEAALCLLRGGLRLRQLIRRERPDLVISWQAMPTLLVGHMCGGLSVPVIIAVRNSIPERIRSVPLMLQHAALRHAFALSKLVIANSRAGVDGYRALRLLGNRPTRVIPNGIDRARFRLPNRDDRHGARAMLGLAPDARAVLYVGRASAVKQLHLLAATLARAGTMMPDVDLVVIGVSGDELQYAADAAGVVLPAARVVMPGWMDQIERAYWACDALLLTSSHEGSPNVVHEARACGLPVVSTDCGDVRATANAADRIVASDAAALARALQDVLLPDAARPAPAIPFDVTDCAREWHCCIEELLAEHQQRS